MTGGAMIASLIAVTAALFLAVRSFRAHGLSFERGAVMAVAWLLIILTLGFVLTRMGF